MNATDLANPSRSAGIEPAIITFAVSEPEVLLALASEQSGNRLATVEAMKKRLAAQCS